MHQKIKNEYQRSIQFALKAEKIGDLENAFRFLG